MKAVLLAMMMSTMFMSGFASAAESNNCAEYLKTDKELNDVYKEIQVKYKNDALFLKKLKKAQNAWIVFRDAQLEAKYPAEKKMVEYGTMFIECECIDKNALTVVRLNDLKQWLTKIPEGESCRGSRT